jgi:hypothetical protein
MAFIATFAVVCIARPEGAVAQKVQFTRIAGYNTVYPGLTETIRTLRGVLADSAGNVVFYAETANNRGLLQSAPGQPLRVLADSYNRKPGTNVSIGTVSTYDVTQPGNVLFSNVEQVYTAGMGGVKLAYDPSVNEKTTPEIRYINTIRADGDSCALEAMLADKYGTRALFTSGPLGMRYVLDANTTIPATNSIFGYFVNLAYRDGRMAFVSGWNQAEGLYYFDGTAIVKVVGTGQPYPNEPQTTFDVGSNTQIEIAEDGLYFATASGPLFHYTSGTLEVVKKDVDSFAYDKGRLAYVTDYPKRQLWLRENGTERLLATDGDTLSGQKVQMLRVAPGSLSGDALGLTMQDTSGNDQVWRADLNAAAAAEDWQQYQ